MTPFFRNFLLAFVLISIAGPAVGQCSVTINQPDTVRICQGDSVTLVANVSGGGSILDQSHTATNAGTSARSLPGYSYFQSFTAGVSGTLNKLEIGFFNFINGTSTLKIYSGSGVNGASLYSQNVNISCPSGNCLVPFNLSLPLNAGGRYTFEIIPVSNMPDPYGLQMEVPGSYPGGKFGIKDPGGIDTANGFDWVFRTWMQGALYQRWNTGSTAGTLTVRSSGWYVMTVTDSASCTARDSVYVMVIPSPAPSLGPDTSFCAGNSVTLDAGPGYSAYQWSNGDVTRNVNISLPGTYDVVVKDSYNCKGRDTVQVTQLMVYDVDLGPDQTFCADDSATISPGPWFSGYLWSDNSTGTNLVVHQPGTFWVRADSMGCSDQDTITLTQYPALSPSFTFTQSQNMVTFTATAANVNAWLWDFGDGDTSSLQNPVHAFPNQSGSYQVCLTVSSSNGCDEVFCDSVTLLITGLNRNSPTPVRFFQDEAEAGFLGVNSEQPFSLELFGLDGKRMGKITADRDQHSIRMQTANLASGIYLITLIAAEEKIIRKLIIP